MEIAIVGTGYVGLVTGVSLAKAGHQVILVERRKEVVESISAGRCPFFEPQLPQLLRAGLEKKLLHVTGDLEDAVSQSELTLTCVGTPSEATGKIDLSDIFSAAAQIGKALRDKKGRHTIVVKSTVVPGTTEEVGKIIGRESGKRAGQDFGLGMNPEFLREGNAVEDVLNPDRIVLGAEDEKSRETMNRMYAYTGAPKLDVNIRTAEMIKYANNAYFAMAVSFANEISQICERIGGVNAYDVMKGVAMDGRITRQIGGRHVPAGVAAYLIPGCGFGGSCFPKDVRAISYFSKAAGYRARLVENTIEINQEQANAAIEKLRKGLGGIAGKTVAVLGVTFKPDTDDLRESPALKIIDAILSEGGEVKAADPQGLENARRIYGDKIGYFTNPDDALDGADGAVLVTKWAQFAGIPPGTFKSRLKRPFLLDCRGFYDFASYSKSLDFHILGYRERGA